MDSRTEFAGRIHFFEYFSLEKFEESLRNALQYSIGIITQQDRFIQYFQYTKEIAFLIEFCINLPYALKYNTSYAEYFYGFYLSEQKQNKKFKRIATLMIRILIPYILQKLHEYSINPNSNRGKKITQYLYRGFKLIDILMKFQYLLNDEQKSYSVFYYLIKQDLIRFKMESPYKYGMLFVYLGLKFLDFYFSKKNNKVYTQIGRFKKCLEILSKMQKNPINTQRFKNNRICILFRMFIINGNSE
ncbi:unnamed protein product [Paramecium sonneborni]|uniref:Pex N-terminal domain-containing protein n=1 Tax=Paramecium sonneborni TaxID=65129 RepID=A0A8S1KQX0_9CILI|nr:unnamed protein product [Paramecium sonneborni]